MIFENNYTYAGTTAILYKFKTNYPDLGFYIDSNNKILLQSSSELIEFGIRYKKVSDDNWTYFRIANETLLNRVKNGTGLLNTGLGVISGDGNLFNPPYAYYKYNYMSPIIVAIRNLEQETTYNIESYYKLSSSGEHTFNLCSSTTIAHQNIMYNCTEVTGDTDEHNEYLRNTINKACGIYNEMTAFTQDSSHKSYTLGDKNGGSFVAKIENLEGAAADSRMYFSRYTSSISTVVHEMAHNLMYPQVDETENEETYNKIVKFMEFATDAQGATWRWNNGHNYPVISSANYEGVYNYLVAAACYVSRSTVENGI